VKPFIAIYLAVGFVISASGWWQALHDENSHLRAMLHKVSARCRPHIAIPFVTLVPPIAFAVDCITWPRLVVGFALLNLRRRKTLPPLPHGIPIIKVQPERPCAFCKQVKELRPYGPNREKICFQCAMKDEDTTTRRFTEDVLGEVYKPLPIGICSRCGETRQIVDEMCHQCRGKQLLGVA
jgi:hypothetical protein